MKQYRDLVKRIIADGEYRADRTGVGTYAIFGGRIEFDLRERFPLVNCKQTRWKTAFLEMLFFLNGQTNVAWLNQRGSKLWDAWAKEDGELGPVYGSQWIYWNGSELNQIEQLIEGLKSNPAGRRHIVSAWNPEQLPRMALPPCHWAFQCYVTNSKVLHMQVQQRSWDVALGAPFNIAQYAFLLEILARQVGMIPGVLSFCYGDAHLYANHIEAMKEVVERPVIEDKPRLLHLSTLKRLQDYEVEDFAIEGYEYHPHVPLEIAV